MKIEYRTGTGAERTFGKADEKRYQKDKPKDKVNMTQSPKAPKKGKR